MLPDPANSSPILPRSKLWWLALALLLILAGWFYLRGYNVSLPYFAQHDELVHLVAAQHIIDFGSARNFRNHDAYPPGMTRLNYLLLKHVKQPGAHHGTVLPVLRLITIAAWMTAVVVIALLGSLMAHPLTGLMAAAIWIVNPWVVARAHFALPDGYLTFFTLLSLWLALVGCLKGRRSFSTAAVYSIMLAACFKTQAIFVAPLVMLLPLVRLWSSPGDRIEIWKQVFWNGFRLGIFLFWFILLTPFLSADRIPGYPAQFEKFSVPSVQVLWMNLEQILRWFWVPLSWLGLLMISMLLRTQWRRVNGTAVVSVSLAALAWLVGISLFGMQHIRQFYAMGALLVLLYALGLSILCLFMVERLSRLDVFSLPPRLGELLVTGSLAALLAIGLIPAFQASDALTYDFTLPDRRTDLAQYMDKSLEPGVYATIGEVHTVFMRDVGGYDGIHDFPWFPEEVFLPDKPLEIWRVQGIEYAIMPHAPMLEDPDIYYPDETVLLKTYPVDPNFRGPDMVVLRLYPMQYQTDQLLGPVRLVGYDINSTELQAGEDIVLRHYWRADHPTSTAHHVYNHLLDAAGEIVSQTDYVPLWDSRRDTTSWDDPDEIMLGRNFTLNLPIDLPPGAYQLISGFYDPLTWQRLSSPEGADYLSITEITVTQADA